MNESKAVQGFFKEVLEYFKIILIALLIAILTNTLLFSISNVRETSMEPTLIEGDVMVLNRIVYSFSAPKAGDIVVLIDNPEADMSFLGKVKRMFSDLYYKVKKIEHKERLVKRVVAVGGDKVDIIEGRLYVNGMSEAYIGADVTTDSRGLMTYPFVVSEGEAFLLGDNRPSSRDGRNFGTVQVTHIEGKVGLRIFPLNKIGLVQ